MNQTDLTPVHVFTQLASLVFGMSVAMVVGPYIVIGIGAMGGAAVMIMQRQGDGNIRAFIYFLASAAVAVLLTVPISMMVASFWEPIRDQWLFAPVSFGLGYVGDKYPAIMSWVGSKISAFVDVLIAARGQK
ncbi:hypothetical protein [Variovorax sp. PAMC26660]|uniref:hypothetical protein n=1 Tax=Variovorax sp. PAMC26660 TaxID=2762322 RepID=UPI00164DFEC8|nr:hypothetical protein [Variovorax sp. PAMC26660]QNK65893.1 hypothetical protein H7F35_22110 [Variovorax sp. PAMC26660]